MVNAHQGVEVDWFRSSSRDESGTTAISVLLESSTGRIAAANVGDSRAIIVRGKKIISLSTDQDAANKKEAVRIKGVGGTINKAGYINGFIQVSRSVGDYDSKFVESNDANGEPAIRHSMAVVATPDIVWGQLQPDDILVLCCDGVIEPKHPSATWIGKHVRSSMDRGKTAQEAAESLAQEALDMGSQDNVSVLIVAPTAV
jgi:serine/threonine protein phosphatase PrpC